MITQLQQSRLDAIAAVQDWALIGLVVIAGAAVIWAIWAMWREWK